MRVPFQGTMTWRMLDGNKPGPRHVPRLSGLFQESMQKKDSRGVFGRCLSLIGVLFGWFAENIAGPGLGGVYSVYQGNPSIFPKGHLGSVLMFNPCNKLKETVEASLGDATECVLFNLKQKWDWSPELSSAGSNTGDQQDQDGQGRKPSVWTKGKCGSKMGGCWLVLYRLQGYPPIFSLGGP